MINRVYFYSFSWIMQEQGLIQHYTDLFKEWNIPENSNFLKLHLKLRNFFNSLGLEDKKIILAISWWADSMIVATQVLFYYSENNFNLNNVHIAHCNHKIRIESEDEADFMSKFFLGLNFHLFERDNWEKEDENSLRNWRYSKFSSLQKLVWATYVFLGHHLNDRVESTFLNLMRGAWINWFLNMRNIEEHHLLPDDCMVCRPLLNIPKSEILYVCSEVWIPFFEDKTNFDNSISKRNRVRNQILNPLSKYASDNNEENKFLESFSNIYKQIENFENKWYVNELINIPSFPLWKVKYSYLWNRSILECDEDDVFELFKILRIQISSNVVNERKIWLNNWKNWFKYIGWVYFFIHEKKLYIIKANKEFWIRKNNYEENNTVEIESMENIWFLGLNLNIPRYELIWCKVRLPLDWDKFWWKSWHRWSLNQKIPMRWREWIPLAIKDRKVIHMWKNIWK